MLKIKTETTHFVDYNDLDNFIRKELGWKKYEFTCIEECDNDSSHSFDIDGKLDSHALETIEKWKKGEFVHYSNYTVLNYLCSLNYIPSGKYVIEVCW